jgi:hypothetical protein
MKKMVKTSLITDRFLEYVVNEAERAKKTKKKLASVFNCKADIYDVIAKLPPFSRTVFWAIHTCYKTTDLFSVNAYEISNLVGCWVYSVGGALAKLSHSCLITRGEGEQIEENEYPYWTSIFPGVGITPGGYKRYMGYKKEIDWEKAGLSNDLELAIDRASWKKEPDKNKHKFAVKDVVRVQNSKSKVNNRTGKIIRKGYCRATIDFGDCTWGIPYRYLSHIEENHGL